MLPLINNRIQSFLLNFLLLASRRRPWRASPSAGTKGSRRQIAWIPAFAGMTVVFVVLGFLRFSHVFAATGINRQINFQGKVVNKTAGTNVTNGNYDFTFRLYDASSGGTLLWTENWTAAGGGQLAVTDGIFRVALGSHTTFASASVDFTSDSLYLDITFNAETMGSRIRFTAVPYAFYAEKVAGLSFENNESISNGTDGTIFFGRNDAGTVTLSAKDDDSTAALTIVPGGAAGLTFGNASTTSITVTTDGTGNGEVVLPTGSIATGEFLDGSLLPADLQITGSTTDEYCLTYETTGAQFEWQTCGGTNYWQLNAGALSPFSLTAELNLGHIATDSAKVSLAGSLTRGKAVAIFNQTESQDIITASASGTTRFRIANNGDAFFTDKLQSTQSTVNELRLFDNGISLASYLNAAYKLDNDNNDSTESYTVQTNGGQSTLFTLSQSGNTGNAARPLVGFGIASPEHALHVNTWTTGKALAVFNETGNQDILTASASGTTKFRIANNGRIYMDSSYYNASCTALETDLNGQIMCGTDDGGGGTNYFQLNAGVLSPFSLTAELNLGAIATDSAKVSLAGSLTRGKAVAIFNQTEGQDILAASSSGTTRFSIANDGAITHIPTSTTGTGYAILAASLSNGAAQRITGSGATMLTGGELVDLVLGANTVGAGVTITGTGAYTGTGAADGFLNIVGNALTTGDGSKMSFTGLTSGSGLEIIGGTSMTTNGELLDLNMGAATAGNGLNVTTTGVYTGTGLINVTANSATTGIGQAISMTGLTTGSGQRITGSGATMQTGGELVDLVLGANTVGAGVTITGTGAYTGTGAADGFLNIVGNALTTGDGSKMSFTGLTSGSGLEIIGGTSMTTNGELLDLNMGAATAGNGINIATTGVYTGTGLSVLTANSATTGIGQAISMTGLTTGSGQRITGSGATMQTGGELVDLVLGANTVGAGVTITGTGAYTGTGAADGFLNIVGNALTTGDGSKMSFTGLTSGTGLEIIGNTAMTTNGELLDLNMGAATAGNGSNITTTGVYTGTGLSVITANSATTGLGQAISMTGLTTGSGLRITGGTAMTTNGELLDLNMGAATAGNGSVVTTTGVYTGTGLSTITANSATTGVGQAISMTGLTTGSGMSITGGASMTTNGELLDLNMGAATAGNGVNIATTGVYTGTGLINATANSATTGTIGQFTANGMTTGNVLALTSSSTALTTGSMFNSTYTGTAAFSGILNNINWTPGSATTATGDVFRVALGSNGNVGNIFNVVDGSTSVFSVKETAITSALPHSFTAAGDVSIAYDIVMTNQTASYIKSNGPFTLEAGESFESNDLTLASYNSGSIVLDPGATGNVELLGATNFNTQLTLANDATPDVSAGTWFVTGGTTTITDFDAGASGTLRDGQIVIIESAHAVTIDCAGGATEMFCATTTDIALGDNDTIMFIYNATTDVWHLISWFDYSDAAQTGSDLAEWFVSNDRLEPGHVVSIDPLGTSEAYIQKSQTAQDTTAIGIIATAPGITLGTRPEVNGYQVALAGRVPVKVSGENGPIKKGDYLTTSVIPGYAAKAVKAGPTIGKALDNFTGTGSATGMANVFVNISWYDPRITITSSGNLQILENSMVPVSDTIFDSGDSRDVLDSNAATSSAILLLQQEVKDLTIQVSELKRGSASDSAMIQQFLQQMTFQASMEATFQSTDKKMAETFGTVDISAPGGATVEGKLRVKESSLFEEIVTVIDTLITNNFIVNGFADFFGKVTFREDVAIRGKLTVGNDTSGIASIRKGTDRIEVRFQTPYQTVPLVTTSIALDSMIDEEASDDLQKQQEAAQVTVEKAILSGDIQYLVTRKSMNGFIIMLNKKAPVDMQFSWTAVTLSQSSVSSPDKQSRFGESSARREADKPEAENRQLKTENRLSPSPSPTNKPDEGSKTVTILESELGYLRVRSEPRSSSDELGQVKPDETFTIVHADNGWYEIEFEKGRRGWVSSLYVRVTY